MKWPVYILLMAALSYVGETVRLPYKLLQQQETTTCCHQGKEVECPYMHPEKMPKDNKSGSCNPTANCTNCPLCYTAELTATYTSAGISATIARYYPEIPGRQLPGYTASTWKPPNA